MRTQRRRGCQPGSEVHTRSPADSLLMNSSLQNREQINSYCFRRPFCEDLLWRPQLTGAVPVTFNMGQKATLHLIPKVFLVAVSRITPNHTDNPWSPQELLSCLSELRPRNANGCPISPLSDLRLYPPLSTSCVVVPFSQLSLITEGPPASGIQVLPQ